MWGLWKIDTPLQKEHEYKLDPLKGGEQVAFKTEDFKEKRGWV